MVSPVAVGVFEGVFVTGVGAEVLVSVGADVSVGVLLLVGVDVPVGVFV